MFAELTGKNRDNILALRAIPQVFVFFSRQKHFRVLGLGLRHLE